MSERMTKAKALLQGGYTCALYTETQTFTSEKRGVAPLLEWLESGEDFHGFSAADKVVGKAAAFLYVLLGVEQVYALVLSEAAESVFRAYHIPVYYEEKVTAIRNRSNTGFCPMEQAVLGLNDPKEAHEAILKKLQELKKEVIS